MSSSPYQIQINQGQYYFEITPENAENADFVQDSAGKIHILKNGKSYSAEILSADFDARSIEIMVNGRRFSVHISDKYEKLLKDLGLTIGGNQKMNMVKAPMPGLVLQIMVKSGDEVKKGDPMIILEAMKMENMLKATGEGIVKSIKVSKGQPVEKGSILIEMA
jgi:biotin carboxyl carrier protein